MRTKKPWLEFITKINELQSTKPDGSDSTPKKSGPLLTFYNGTDDVTVMRKKLTKE